MTSIFLRLLTMGILTYALYRHMRAVRRKEMADVFDVGIAIGLVIFIGYLVSRIIVTIVET